MLLPNYQDMIPKSASSPSDLRSKKARALSLERGTWWSNPSLKHAIVWKKRWIQRYSWILCNFYRFRRETRWSKRRSEYRRTFTKAYQKLRMATSLGRVIRSRRLHRFRRQAMEQCSWAETSCQPWIHTKAHSKRSRELQPSRYWPNCAHPRRSPTSLPSTRCATVAHTKSLTTSINHHPSILQVSNSIKTILRP